MKFRLKAFGWHLSASFFLGLCVLVLVFGIWYPAPLDKLTGVGSIFLILLVVDIIIGPLLTLVVAKEGKKSLKYDFLVIVSLQLIAFAYGVKVVADGRPVWLVFNIDRVDVIQAYQIDYSHAESIAPEYKSGSLVGPQWVAALPPGNITAREELMFSSLMGGSDIQHRPDLYISIATAAPDIVKHARPITDLYRLNSDEHVNKALSEWPKADAFLPIQGKNGWMVVLVHKDVGHIFGIADLKPE
jgi:hypothetical protein